MTTPAPTKKAAQPQAEGKTETGDPKINDASTARSVMAGDSAEVVTTEGTVPTGVYDLSGEAESFVTLSKDIVEEFYFPDTKRPSYRLLYSKGQVVSKAAIEAYNADTEAANARRENGGVDPENPAGIDSTTLASGTNSHLQK